MLQRFVSHHGSEVRAADTDVDDVANRFPGEPFPLAPADAIGKIGHLIQHGMHFGNHVLAVHDDRLILGRAQGHMQHRALLGDVDLVAAKHGIDARTQVRLFRQLEQKLDGFIGDAVFRIIEKDAFGLGRQALSTLRVGSEQLPQMHLADFFRMTFETLPCRPRGERASCACLGYGSHTSCSFSSGFVFEARLCSTGRPVPAARVQRRNPPTNALALSPSAAACRQLFKQF